MKLYIVMLFVVLAFADGSYSQYVSSSDPGAKEDAAIERKKILKASDQIDGLVAQVAQLQSDLKSLRDELNLLRSDNQSLRQQLAQSEADRSKERETILTEVSKQVEKSNKQLLAATALSEERRNAAEEKKEQKAAPAPAPTPGEKQEGYEYVVQSGDTLWKIVKAYQENKVNVTVAEIRKANDMKPTDSIHVGQKLFIPKK